MLGIPVLILSSILNGILSKTTEQNLFKSQNFIIFEMTDDQGKYLIGSDLYAKYNNCRNV